MNSDRPLALVTNDDGIDSFFLHTLIRALQRRFRTVIAAPAEEQSWIGRAITRRDAVTVEEFDELGCPGWRIGGTPTDCVNIALEHLLKERPAIVVSGINLGFNTTVPLILSSGTVAGALEGAFAGLPAVAFSKLIQKKDFEAVSAARGRVTGAYLDSLLCAAEHATRITEKTLAQRLPTPTVVNVNFPIGTTPETICLPTVPAPMRMTGLFDTDGPGTYRFRYRPSTEVEDHPGTDLHALAQGAISISEIDASRLGILPRA